MAKMRCACGNVMSNSQSPCATEGRLVGYEASDDIDSEVERLRVDFQEAVQQDRRDTWIAQRCGEFYPQWRTDEEILDELRRWLERKVEKKVWECDQCGRLYIQRAPGGNSFQCFVPEPNDGYSRVLARPAKDAS